MARAAPRPLFGLALSGVCLAIAVTSNAVVSYTTLSPLPVHQRKSLVPSAVSSLWHFPSPRDARPLAGTLPFRARTFLEAVALGAATRDPHSLPEFSNSKNWFAESRNITEKGPG
jgi:hypothetical protein